MRDGCVCLEGELKGRREVNEKRSDNPSKLTPATAPGEMQIWFICHVCLGILIPVRGWGFSLAALWFLSDLFLPFLLPSLLLCRTLAARRRLPGPPEVSGELLANWLWLGGVFRILQLFRFSSFRFLRFRKEKSAMCQRCAPKPVSKTSLTIYLTLPLKLTCSYFIMYTSLCFISSYSIFFCLLILVLFERYCSKIHK